MINGIKPKMTTTTKLRIKPTSFDEAMNQFCEKLTENCQEYIERFNHMDSVEFKPCGGRKYIKVKSFEDKIMTDYDENGVEMKTLNLYILSTTTRLKFNRIHVIKSFDVLLGIFS